MENEVKITITIKEYEDLLKISTRYYFGLFKEITTSEDEELEIRDTLINVTERIRESYYDSLYNS